MAQESSPNESLLGRVFDAYQNMTQVAGCIREAARQRSVPRPRVLELSRRDLQHRHPDWDLFEPFNRVYNERLAPYDYREPCYRYLIVVATDARVDVDVLADRLRGPTEVPASVTEADGLVLETFRAVDASLADRPRKSAADAEHVLEVIRRLQRDNEWALQEIAQLRTAGGTVTRDDVHPD